MALLVQTHLLSSGAPETELARWGGNGEVTDTPWNNGTRTSGTRAVSLQDRVYAPTSPCLIGVSSECGHTWRSNYCYRWWWWWLRPVAVWTLGRGVRHAHQLIHSFDGTSLEKKRNPKASAEDKAFWTFWSSYSYCNQAIPLSQPLCYLLYGNHVYTYLKLKPHFIHNNPP